MSRILVCTYSRTGHTRRMGEIVAEAAAKVDTCRVDQKQIAEITPENLLDYDAIVLGSPTYYGTMAAEIKLLLDNSVKIHGQLAGKVGGAFASSANVGGGNETTVLDLLKAMLIHGMIIPGSASGDHYGPVSVGQPDDRVVRQCENLGRIVAELAVRLSKQGSE
ncbi:MAG: flavodoxin family protein [Planctomycetota bacterium]